MREYRDPEYEKVVVKAFALGGFAALAAILVCLFRIAQTLISL